MKSNNFGLVFYIVVGNGSSLKCSWREGLVIDSEKNVERKEVVSEHKGWN